MRTALTMASVLLATGCGGSSSAPESPTNLLPPSPQAHSPGGIWFVPGAPETAVTMFIAESGVLKVFDAGWLGTGAVIVTNGNEVAGSYDAIRPGVTSDPRELQRSCDTSGTVNARVSLTLTLSCEDGIGARDERTLTFMYEARYERASSLATIAGNYAVPISALTNTLSISTNGVIFGAFRNGGANCTANGLVEVIDPDFTIYGIEMTLSACTGGAAVFFEGVTLSGLLIGEAPGAAAGAFLLLASITVDDGVQIYSLLYERV